jgi:hypothetical protein
MRTRLGELKPGAALRRQIRAAAKTIWVSGERPWGLYTKVSAQVGCSVEYARQVLKVAA